MSSHYYSKRQDSELKLKEFKTELRGKLIKFLSGSGVFCKGKIDSGSKLLIEKSIIEEGQDILDLGCGYGAVGLSLAKKFTRSNFTLTDINERAISLARKNMKINQLENVKIKKGNVFEKIESKFDTILLNPPQSAGKKLCLQMIQESKEYLKDNGTLQIVVRHQKGGKSLSKYMNEVFGNVTDIAKKSGYRIYLSKKE